MKFTIEKRQMLKTEIEVSEYFTTFKDWFYKSFPDGSLLKVTPAGLIITDYLSLNMIEDKITPCTQEEFVAAYVATINAISAASGIEHLPLQMEPDFLTESNPES